MGSVEAAAYATSIFLEVSIVFLYFRDGLSSLIRRLHCKRSRENVVCTQLNIPLQV